MAYRGFRPTLLRFPSSLLLWTWLLHAAIPAWAENASRWPKLEEVIVVSKTHFDIGFTDLASRVVDRYRTSMADQALRLVDESSSLPRDQQFSWTLAGWPMSQVLWSGQTPERRERFLAAMRAGRLVPHALAFTTHTESLDLEDFVRGFRFSVEMARLAGRPLTTAGKMTDVTSHTRVTATVLAQAGVKFFHLGCNDNCSHPDLPQMFWWEGPDGSRVLTVFSARYGSELCPPPDWPYKTWLCMWMTYDNQGPPNVQAVRALWARAKKDLPGVRVRFGQLSDFADAVLREKPQLPVVRGDMPDTWIHGIGSMPIETQLAHATRPRVAALESLDTLLSIWSGASPSAGKIVGDAYENTLLFGEHTWGPDVHRYAGYAFGDAWKKRLAAGDYDFMLEGFNQKRAYARKAAAVVEPAIQQRMAALAAAVRVAGRRVVVFNPLPWVRDAAVDVPWNGAAPAVADAAGGEPLPAAVERGRLRFMAKDLPPLGYKTFVAAAQPVRGAVSADARARVLENELLRITLDPVRCGIASILDKKSGRELVDRRSPYALGQYLYERFDSDQGKAFARAYVKPGAKGEMDNQGKPNMPSAKECPYCVAAAEHTAMEICGDAVSAQAVLTAAPRGIIPNATQLSVTLYAGQPWLDLEWSITQKTPDPWPEAGWLCFPLRADDPSFQLARLGSIVDPAKDLIPGSNHEILCLNGGLVVAAADGRRTGICPVDAQLISLEHRGLWRYSREFVPHKADVFVNLFNNVYSTNFAQWSEGSWSSRVRVWLPREGQSTAASLIAGSWQSRLGCLATVSDAAPGKLPPSAAGLVVEKLRGGSPAGLLVTAFGANPYGDGTLLRLWEQTGDSGVYTVRLPRGMKVRTAQPCDLRGQPRGSPIAVSDQGTFAVPIHPMAPMSLILQ